MCENFKHKKTHKKTHKIHKTHKIYTTFYCYVCVYNGRKEDAYVYISLYINIFLTFLVSSIYIILIFFFILIVIIMLKQFLLHHVSRQSSSSIRPSYYKKLVAAYTTTSNNNNGTTRQARVLDLILVRHGESEGNVARQLSLSGDHSLYEGEFLKRHSSLWRLTDKGRAQSRAAGSWIKQNFDINSFNRHYTSEYIRAMETAALLDFPKECNWFAEVFLRERDWGQLDLMSQEERIKKFSHELKRRDRDRFFWSPPGGESLANVAQRVDRFLTMLHRECPDEKAIVVCHGEVMWAFRLRLERMSHSLPGMIKVDGEVERSCTD